MFSSSEEKVFTRFQAAGSINETSQLRSAQNPGDRTPTFRADCDPLPLLCPVVYDCVVRRLRLGTQVNIMYTHILKNQRETL